MAGIYLHIPFCKTKCSYCDFFSRTSLKNRAELVDAMLREIIERKKYLSGTPVSTIYFGGGTPSVLSGDEIQRLLNTVFANFEVEKEAEITLEANPDDLNVGFLTDLRKNGINRLSIGIQSFDDVQLKLIRRRHTAEDAVKAVKNAQSAGFDNISIDLIYGLPGQTLSSWNEQVDKALSLNVQHISAYGLTYEEGTLLWQQLQKGIVKMTEDETMIDMYRSLVDKCTEHGFEPYEISNFALSGYRSRHNSAYWKQEPYLGIGPAAHAYNGISRSWNVASIAKYIENIGSGNSYFETEILSEQDRYNDFVMVSLRTREGINLPKLQGQFGLQMMDYCLKNGEKYIQSGKISVKDDFLRLNFDGILISDRIISDLMKI